MTRYFGTYGIRGRVGKLPITPDVVMRLGFAAGAILLAREREVATPYQKERLAVLIGKDTRISGYMLESALEVGFAAAGVDIMLAGPIPTPAVAYPTRALRLQAGIVISASHNPFPDNGIKFLSAQGTKMDIAPEAEIEARLDQPMDCLESGLPTCPTRLAAMQAVFARTIWPGSYHASGRPLGRGLTGSTWRESCVTKRSGLSWRGRGYVWTLVGNSCGLD